MDEKETVFEEHRKYLHEVVDSYTQLSRSDLSELHAFVDLLEIKNPIEKKYVKLVRDEISKHLTKMSTPVEASTVGDSKLENPKRCPHCMNVKALSEFSSNGWCKECNKQYRKDNYKPKKKLSGGLSDAKEFNLPEAKKFITDRLLEVRKRIEVLEEEISDLTCELNRIKEIEADKDLIKDLEFKKKGYLCEIENYLK